MQTHIDIEKIYFLNFSTTKYEVFQKFLDQVETKKISNNFIFKSFFAPLVMIALLLKSRNNYLLIWGASGANSFLWNFLLWIEASFTERVFFVEEGCFRDVLESDFSFSYFVTPKKPYFRYTKADWDALKVYGSEDATSVYKDIKNVFKRNRSYMGKYQTPRTSENTLTRKQLVVGQIDGDASLAHMPKHLKTNVSFLKFIMKTYRSEEIHFLVHPMLKGKKRAELINFCELQKITYGSAPANLGDNASSFIVHSRSSHLGIELYEFGANVKYYPSESNWISSLIDISNSKIDRFNLRAYLALESHYYPFGNLSLNDFTTGKPNTLLPQILNSYFFQKDFNLRGWKPEEFKENWNTSGALDTNTFEERNDFHQWDCDSLPKLRLLNLLIFSQLSIPSAQALYLSKSNQFMDDDNQSIHWKSYFAEKVGLLGHRLVEHDLAARVYEKFLSKVKAAKLDSMVELQKSQAVFRQAMRVCDYSKVRIVGEITQLQFEQVISSQGTYFHKIRMLQKIFVFVIALRSNFLAPSKTSNKIGLRGNWGSFVRDYPISFCHQLIAIGVPKKDLLRFLKFSLGTSEEELLKDKAINQHVSQKAGLRISNFKLENIIIRLSLKLALFKIAISKETTKELNANSYLYSFIVKIAFKNSPKIEHIITRALAAKRQKKRMLLLEEARPIFRSFLSFFLKYTDKKIFLSKAFESDIITLRNKKLQLDESQIEGVVFSMHMGCKNSQCMTIESLDHWTRNRYLVVDPFLSTGTLALNAEENLKILDEIQGIVAACLRKSPIKLNFDKICWKSKQIVYRGVNYYQPLYETLAVNLRRHDITLTNDEEKEAFSIAMKKLSHQLTIMYLIEDFSVSAENLRTIVVVGNFHVIPNAVFRDTANKANYEVLLMGPTYGRLFSGKFENTLNTFKISKYSDQNSKRAPFLISSNEYEELSKKAAKDPDYLNNKRKLSVFLNSKISNSTKIKRSMKKLDNWRKTNPNGRVFLVLGKVAVDLAVPRDGGKIFSSYKEFVRGMSKFAKDSPNNFFVFRPHPHENNRQISLSLVDFMEDWIDQSLPNIEVARATEYSISDLWHNFDMALIYNGSAISEYTALGKKVAVFSEQAQVDYPLTIFMPEILNQLLTESITVTPQERSKASKLLLLSYFYDNFLAMQHCRISAHNLSVNSPSVQWENSMPLEVKSNNEVFDSWLYYWGLK